MKIKKLTPSQDEAFRYEDRCDNAPCDPPDPLSLHGSGRAHGVDSDCATKNRRHCSPSAVRSNELHGDCLKIFLEFVASNENEGKEKNMNGEFYCVAS